jgi:hypothetical protein
MLIKPDYMEIVTIIPVYNFNLSSRLIDEKYTLLVIASISIGSKNLYLYLFSTDNINTQR